MNEWIEHESYGFIHTKEIVGQAIFDSLEPPQVRCRFEFDIFKLQEVEALAAYDGQRGEIVAVFTNLNVVEIAGEENEIEFLFELSVEDEEGILVAEVYDLCIFQRHQTHIIATGSGYPVDWNSYSAMVSFREDETVRFIHDGRVNFPLYRLLGTCVLVEEGTQEVKMLVAFDNPYLLWRKFHSSEPGEDVDASGMSIELDYLGNDPELLLVPDKCYRIHPLLSTSRIN